MSPHATAPTANDDDHLHDHLPDHLWAIVLAAGEGKRLAPVTRLLYGRDIPKQFVTFDGDKTLLQRTMDRVGQVVPPERTIVVVARERRELAEQQLATYLGVQIVSQPRNVGTGPGVLLPLSHVRARSANQPDAAVLVTPSDHYFPITDPFVSAVRQAARVARRVPSGLALLGADADEPASDLGWIVPAPRAKSAAAPNLVAEFVEKPALPVATELLARGALWNTLIVVGGVDAFWRQAKQHMPGQLALFEDYVAALGRGPEEAERILPALYRSMPAADFSRALLERARGLGVVDLQGSGWCDCGTPQRLLACLDRISGRRPPFLEAVLRRLRAEQDVLATSS